MFALFQTDLTHLIVLAVCKFCKFIVLKITGVFKNVFWEGGIIGRMINQNYFFTLLVENVLLFCLNLHGLFGRGQRFQKASFINFGLETT